MEPERLAEWPQVKSVAPETYGPLGNFSCGSRYAWERIVNEAFRLYAQGHAPESLVMRVAEDDATEELIGACCHMPRPLILTPLPNIDDAAYIPVLGVTTGYRGRRMPDGARIGVFLVEDTLNEIQLTWAGKMPPVWSLVARANQPCHDVLESHGFENVKADHGKHDVWFRPRNLDPDWWHT
jgi:hypothetical protein